MTGVLYVSLTPRIEDFLESAWRVRSTMPSSLQSSLKPFIPDPNQAQSDEEEAGVPFSLLKETLEWMRGAHGREEFLHEILKNASIFIPPPPVPEKDPVLVARLTKMRHQVENRIYAKMVSNVANDILERDRIADRVDLKSGMDTAKLGLNLLLSVISVFTAVYFVVHAAYQNTILSISAGSMGGIAIFMVEIILFVLRGSQLDARIAKDRHDELHGIQSPFPPAAPSLIEAQRKKREERIQQRIEAERQKQLLENPSQISSLDKFALPTIQESKGPVILEEDEEVEGEHSTPLQPLLPVQQ